MRVVAVDTGLGVKFCGPCALIESDSVGLRPWDMVEWEPLTGDMVADEGQAIFESIHDEAVFSYPDFVEAGIDPFMVAQLDAAPHCWRCGLFLVALEEPTIQKGGPLDR